LGTPLQNYLAPYIDLKESTSKQSLFFNQTYFSFKAFRDALTTLKKYIKNILKKNTPLPNPSPLKKSPKKKAIPKPPAIVKAGKVKLLKGYFTNQYDNFALNETKLKKWLGFIKTMTDDNQIKLIVALSPMNKDHLEKLQEDHELVTHWLQVKKIIADVFGSYHDFNNCSASSFRGRLFWGDSVHPSKKLADIMMRVILDQPVNTKIPGSFGMPVTRQTLDEYLLNLNSLCENE
jgi:hypothetical protein